MKIAVFGATGKTGQIFVQKAIEAGHTVNALSRQKPTGPTSTQRDVTWIIGSAHDDPAVAACLEGQDCAISFLGNFNKKPNTEMSDATSSILAAMTAQNVKRFVVITTIGTGDSYKPMTSFVFKMIIKTVARNIWRDRDRQEAVIKASNADWTIIRPGGLRDDPEAKTYQISPSNGPFPKKIAIPRADVAAFGLKALSDNTLIGKTVCQFL